MTAPGAFAPGRTLDTTWLLRASAIAALVLLRVVALAVVLDSGEAYERTSAFGYDTGRYHVIADKHGTPYRDFEVEYPPGSLALVEVVHGPTKADTMQLTGVVMLLLDFVAAAGVAYGWGRRAAIAYLALGLPLMFPPFIYFRVDLLSVALAIWGFALVKRRREIVGGALMGVAVLAKFWPLALLPVLLVRRQWRATTTMLATCGGGARVGRMGRHRRPATGPHVPRRDRLELESFVGGFYRIADGGEIFKHVGAVRTGHVPGGRARCSVWCSSRGSARCGGGCRAASRRTTASSKASRPSRRSTSFSSAHRCSRRSTSSGCCRLARSAGCAVSGRPRGWSLRPSCSRCC